MRVEENIRYKMRGVEFKTLSEVVKCYESSGTHSLETHNSSSCVIMCCGSSVGHIDIDWMCAELRRQG